MVSVEDLMGLGITRRKVHEIALELGLGKAEEYPDDAMPAFQAKIANGSKSNGSNGKSGFSSAHTAAAEEYAADAQEDLQYVQEAAENRAAGMIVGLDALTMYHCATRQFTNKSLQKQVNESRSRVKQVLTGIAAFYEPTSFLSQTPLGQLMNGIGGNGLTSSMRSLSGNGSELEPNDLEVTS